MSEVTDLILPVLQQIQTRMGRIESSIEVVRDDLHNLKVRVTNIDENLAGLNRRMDGFDFRLERIERRLDLIDEPA